jgi:hypothetical protein
VALAILAPQQLAEATAAATDLVCSGCVGTSDIANNAVGSAKIGSGQVGNTDIATSAVTTSKISDTNGVYSVDIVDGQVGTADLASGAIKPIIHSNFGSFVSLGSGESAGTFADCPSGEIITGGGFDSTKNNLRTHNEYPQDADTWVVYGVNEGTDTLSFAAKAICMGPSP